MSLMFGMIKSCSGSYIQEKRIFLYWGFRTRTVKQSLASKDEKFVQFVQGITGQNEREFATKLWEIVKDNIGELPPAIQTCRLPTKPNRVRKSYPFYYHSCGGSNYNRIGNFNPILSKGNDKPLPDINSISERADRVNPWSPYSEEAYNKLGGFDVVAQIVAQNNNINNNNIKPLSERIEEIHQKQLEEAIELSKKEAEKLEEEEQWLIKQAEIQSWYEHDRESRQKTPIETYMEKLRLDEPKVSQDFWFGVSSEEDFETDEEYSSDYEENVL